MLCSELHGIAFDVCVINGACIVLVMVFGNNVQCFFIFQLYNLRFNKLLRMFLNLKAMYLFPLF